MTIQSVSTAHDSRQTRRAVHRSRQGNNRVNRGGALNKRLGGQVHQNRFSQLRERREKKRGLVRVRQAYAQFENPLFVRRR